jgi:hypothetical protein
MPLLTFEEPQPRLNPPVSCWREDMPENHEPQLVPPQLRWLTTQNDTYLEVPRYSTEVIWWGMLFTAVLIFGVMVFFVILCLSMCFYLFASIGFFIFSSMISFFVKMYFVVPRNLPLRFNRKRQKIYIFNYNHSRLPWLNWPVSIRVYNWADVYGEIIFPLRQETGDTVCMVLFASQVLIMLWIVFCWQENGKSGSNSTKSGAICASI